MKREYFACDGRIYCLCDGNNAEITEKDHGLIDDVLERIENFYPTAFAALKDYYGRSALNMPYFRFLMVRRFIKCNFSLLNTKEYDDDGVAFSFEKVDCPLRGECQHEGVICLPKYSTRLSAAELRVMERLYCNESVSEIASGLYLSENTVRNHIKASYVKLGVHSQGEFISYANKNHLFD